MDRVKVWRRRQQDAGPPHKSMGPRHRRHNAGYQLKGRPHRGSQLVARLDYFQDQQKDPITRAEFLDRALKAANDKVRELGWIA